jgi:hypothetical protein
MTTDLFNQPVAEIHYDAILSECKLYRYRLTRWWDDTKPMALFWGLNPSVADAERNDPTVRRFIHFARRENCGGFIAVNWFAWRATDPRELVRRSDQPIIGAGNPLWIRNSIELCRGPIIAAWGGHRIINDRLKELPYLLNGHNLQCLGTTRDGSPRHPLYVRNDAPLLNWPAG